MSKVDSKPKKGNYDSIIQSCLKSYSCRKQALQTQDTEESLNSKIFKQKYAQLPSAFAEELSHQELFERLIQGKERKQGQLLRRKLQEEQENYRQNCTFKPVISYNSHKIAQQYQNDQPAYERLYSSAVQKNRSFNTTQPSNEEEYPFQPNLITDPMRYLNGAKHDLKPIEQRLESIAENKQLLIKQLTEKIRNQQQSEVFKNPISEEIIKSKDQFKKTVLERVEAYMQKKKQKEKESAIEQKQKMQKQCPFQPKINPTTLNLDQNFMKRQDQFIKGKDESNQARISALTEGLFTPQINQISDLIQTHERKNQTLEVKANRLCFEPIQKKKRKIQQIESSLYGECFFQPKINQISKEADPQPCRHKCNHEDKQESFDFIPKINAKSRSLALNKNIDINYSKKKGQQKKKIQMQNQYKELEECTFQPKINHNRIKRASSVKNNVKVSGLDNYMKKMDKIKENKVKQQNWKQKIFNAEKHYQPKKCTTVEQFKLSQAFGRTERTKQYYEEKFRQECPFKPRIRALRN